MQDQSPVQVEREFELKWRLSARASAAISNTALTFGSSIKIAHHDELADARSIVDLLTLGGRQRFQEMVNKGDSDFSWTGLDAGSHIKISARGADADDALVAILGVLSRGDLDHRQAAQQNPSF